MLKTPETATPIEGAFKPYEGELLDAAAIILTSDLARLHSVEIKQPFAKKFEDGSCSVLVPADGIHDGGRDRVTKLSSLYLFDTLGDDLQGYGIVTLHTDDPDPDMHDRPFVDYTRTEEDYREQGLGRRRLISLNEATQQFFHLPLYASRVVNAGALRLWEDLEAEGLVVQDRKTYRFKTPSELI